MQDTGLNRHMSLDKFFTKPEFAEHCCKVVRRIGLVHEGDLVIEPSAGDGSFIPHIKKLTNTCVFIDISPQHNDVKAGNFLFLNPKNLQEAFDRIHIIGNPPFGRQSSMAKKFIKKCSTFANSVSFILPKSFKKESCQQTFPRSFHLIHAEDVPSNMFLVNGTEHDVPCVFQIWEKQDQDRPIENDINAIIPVGYTFVKQNQMPSISFRRVGVNAGNISTIGIEQKSKESHYFIRFDEGIVVSEGLLDTLKQIVFDTNNTVGPKSISKKEVIREFNRVITEFQRMNG